MLGTLSESQQTSNERWTRVSSPLLLSWHFLLHASLIHIFALRLLSPSRWYPSVSYRRLRSSCYWPEEEGKEGWCSKSQAHECVLSLLLPPFATTTSSSPSLVSLRNETRSLNLVSSSLLLTLSRPLLSRTDLHMAGLGVDLTKDRVGSAGTEKKKK